VKAVRSRPFAEWNVVYYDPAKTTPSKILDRLHAKGCPRAAAVAAEEARIGEKISARILNPVAVPGDCFHVVLELPEGIEHQLGLPEGWREIGGPSKKGSRQLYIQTPAKAAQKTYPVSVDLNQDGRRRRLSLSVELVRQLP
jgi:hypothetical protein